MGSEYDGLGRLQTLIYPAITGLRVSYEYDQAGNVASIPGWVTQITYNAAGEPLTATYDQLIPTTAHWSYDQSRGWQTNETLTRGSRHLFDMESSYEPDGLTASETSTTNHFAQRYTYDSAGELTASTGTYGQTLAYDDLGNITDNNRIGSYTYPQTRTCTTATVCSGPDAVTHAGNTTYTYDAAGNMLVAGRERFNWNAKNQLIKLRTEAGQTVRSVFNADGDKVQERSPAGTTDYFGPLVDWQPLHGYTDYVTVNGTLLGTLHGTSKHWYLTDPRGTPRVITDSLGLVAGRRDTTPLGQPLDTIGSQTTIAYAGHRAISTTPLIDMGARDYDPTLGRFLTADTTPPDPETPQTLNRYSYANNDPIDNVDPTGDTTVDDLNSWLTGLASLAEFFNISDSYAYQGGQAIYRSPGDYAYLGALGVPIGQFSQSPTPTGTPTASPTPGQPATSVGSTITTSTGNSQDAGTFIPWAPGSSGSDNGSVVGIELIDPSLLNDVLGSVDARTEQTLETGFSFGGSVEDVCVGNCEFSLERSDAADESDALRTVANGVSANLGGSGTPTGPRPFSPTDYGVLYAGIILPAKEAAKNAVIGAGIGVIAKGLEAVATATEGVSAFTRLSEVEQATLGRLQGLPSSQGLTFGESEHIGAEVVDSLGRSYDFLGNPAASSYFDEERFTQSIADHLLKSNEFTVVDLTGFTEAQRALVSSYLDALPASELARVIRIGF